MRLMFHGFLSGLFDGLPGGSFAHTLVVPPRCCWVLGACARHLRGDSVAVEPRARAGQLFRGARDAAPSVIGDAGLRMEELSLGFPIPERIFLMQ